LIDNNIVKWILVKGDKLFGSSGKNGVGYDAQKDLHSRNGRDETKG
jgi:hypothetical protein